MHYSTLRLAFGLYLPFSIGLRFKYAVQFPGDVCKQPEKSDHASAAIQLVNMWHARDVQLNKKIGIPSEIHCTAKLLG